MIRARSHPPTTEKLLQRLASMIPPGKIAPAQILGAASQSLILARGSSTLLNSEKDLVLFVTAGVSKLVAHIPPDREQILSFHFDGDIVFAPAGVSHAFAIAAIEDSEILVFAAADLFALSASDPGLPLLLCERAIGSLGRCRDKAIVLGRKAAAERVADFLISMAARINTGGEVEKAFTLPMSRRDIGDSLGLTIETVSRQFGELKAAGLIDTSGRSQVRIVNSDGLRIRAGRCREATLFISQI